MDVKNLIDDNVAIVFESKEEAVECIAAIYNQLGSELYVERSGFYYPHATFYDNCVDSYGNLPHNEPALIIKRRSVLAREREKYVPGYCNAEYFRGLGKECIYYSDIRSSFIDDEHCDEWVGDIDILLS